MSRNLFKANKIILPSEKFKLLINDIYFYSLFSIWSFSVQQRGLAEMDLNVMLLSIFCLLPILLLLHSSNIIMICTKKVLYIPAYILMVNCSLSDCIFAIVTSISIILSIHDHNILVDGVSIAFYYSSVLTTFLISLDRFIAVKHCLRYQSIVTDNNLIISIICTWIVSLVLSTIECIERLSVPTLYANRIRRYIRYSIHIIVCFATISLAAYTIRIRNKHSKAINKQRSIFSTIKLKKDMIRSLRSSTYDVFILNVFTSAVILFHSSFTLYFVQTGYSLVTRSAVFFMYAVHMMSNPIVFVLAMKPLKKQYILLYRKFSNKVNVQNSSPPTNQRTSVTTSRM